MNSTKSLRAEYEKIVAEGQQSFFWHHSGYRKQFRLPYHYHPEYELLYIVKGHGQRLVGSSIEHFNPGQLVFLAPNVPHVWMVAPKSELAEVFYVQFLPHFLGDGFFARPEMKSVFKLMERSRSGVIFDPKVSAKAAELFGKFPSLQETQRLFALLEILHLLGQDSKARILSHQTPSIKLNPKHEERMDRVFQYLNQNLTEPITQAEIAKGVHLSSSAFSRLFKRTTGKCFMDVVNDLRIAEVCRRLNETTQTIAEIAYECGYETLSHFNSQFRRVTGTTPSAYRSQLDTLKLKF